MKSNLQKCTELLNKRIEGLNIFFEGEEKLFSKVLKFYNKLYNDLSKAFYYDEDGKSNKTETEESREVPLYCIIEEVERLTTLFKNVERFIVEGDNNYRAERVVNAKELLKYAYKYPNCLRDLDQIRHTNYFKIYKNEELLGMMEMRHTKDGRLYYMFFDLNNELMGDVNIERLVRRIELLKNNPFNLYKNSTNELNGTIQGEHNE